MKDEEEVGRKGMNGARTSIKSQAKQPTEHRIKRKK